MGRNITSGLLKDLVSSVPNREGTVALHGGLPPPECFPLSALHFTLQDGQTVTVPASMAQQQYNIPPSGYPKLRDWCLHHTRRLHNPPRQHDLLITDGSTHGMEMICSLLLDAGDALLVEEYTYPHFLDCVAKLREYDIISVPIDSEGIIPEAMEAILERRRAEGAPLPRILYTVPIGQNPTGAVTAFARKQAVYELCRRHSISFILEDDPYSYLQFCIGQGATMPGLHGLHLNSYLSIDVDGRVCRLDSFAKCLAPGFRLGWATGPALLIEKLAMAIQGSTLGANMISQAIVAEILCAWGDDGLHSHLQKVQAAYAARAAALHAALEKELTGLARWTTPTAGMFLVSALPNFLHPSFLTVGVHT